VPDWEDDAVPISALEHYAYCPRQCALIHVEQTYDENIFTLRGNALHERVDTPGGETSDGLRKERALPVWSRRHGLTGKVDLVEYPGGTPYPVDYKNGPRRAKRPDELQLCAYALCLEEMTGLPVPRGAIYHGGSKRRREVAFDDALRAETVATLAAVRQTLSASRLPPPVSDERCRHCSLKEACLPELPRLASKIDGLLGDLFEPVEPLPGED
jgi:CRISPR-associated exonuclease Cas4